MIYTSNILTHSLPHLCVILSSR